MTRKTVSSLCGLVILLLIVPAVVLANEVHQGRITKVGGDTLTIMGTQTGGPKVIEVPAAAKVFLDAQPSKLANLQIGHFAEVTCSEERGKLIAKQIHAFSKRSP